jgi:glycosyltransferase involved in cell wall biosynthesis
MALITVIIPVLNGLPYLSEMLASLEIQTFRDFEVILWDNGSKDETVKLAKSWIPRRLPGRVVAENPLPLHECLARMVDESSTELCARIDADDIALPDRFEKQVAFLQAHPECDGVGGQMELINEQSEKIGLAESAPMTFPAILFTMLWRNAMPHPAMMFRRKAVLAAGNYRANSPVEDYDLWLRMCSRGQLANLSEVVLKYRLHSASICAREKQAGLLIQKMHFCTKCHALKLFKLEDKEIQNLLDRKMICSLPALERLLQVVSERSGNPKLLLRLMPEFHAAGRNVCHRFDLPSRLYLAVLESRARGKSIFRMFLDKLNAY